MTIFVAETDRHAGAWVAGLIVLRLRAQIRYVLALPTGRTPVPVYAALRQTCRDGHLPTAGLRAFNLDEYVGLGRGDAGAFRTELDEALYAPLGLTATQVDGLDGRAADLGAECRRYDAAIRDAGGIDLALLGLGRNGHIAFNEPGASLQVSTHVETLTDSSRAAGVAAFGGVLSDVPHQALTMGIGTLLASRAIVLMATGEGKAEAVQRMVEGDLTTECPASFLQLHADVTVVLDPTAAAGLRTSGWRPLPPAPAA